MLASSRRTRRNLARLLGASLLCGALPALSTAPAFAAAPEPPALEAYGSLPSVIDFAISPDGTRTAAIRYFEGQFWLLILNSQIQPITRLPMGTNKFRGLTWADDETILITNSATVSLGMNFTASKYEMTGTIIVPLNAENASGLIFKKTRKIANTTRGAHGIRRVDGKTIGYYGGIELDVNRKGDSHFVHGRPTLYAVDLASNRANQVAHAAGEDHWRDWLVDGQGVVAATLETDTRNGDWDIVNAHGDELARGNNPTHSANLIAFGKDGRTIVYELRDEQGRDRWFEVPLAGGEAVEYLPGIDLERLYTDPRNGQIMGYREAGESPKTVMFDPQLDTKLAMIFKAFPGRNPRLQDWTANFDQVIVHTEGNADSGTWYWVDVPGRRAEAIGDDRPAIETSQVGPVSAFEYTAGDGLELDGVLSLPPGREARDLPLVVLPHGGPHASDEVGFDWWAQAFASRGYAVFQPNFRGSTGRGNQLRNAGHGEWGRAMQTDISDGVQALAEKGIVDPTRACIVGASYGGYAALAGVTLQQGLYRCAASVAGVSDVALMYRTDIYESGGSHMVRNSLRENLGDRDDFDAISPRRHAEDADAPILLVHGKDDTVVPFEQSSKMADALKDAGKPYEVVVLDEEDHWLSRAETRKAMLKAVVGFVAKHNPAD
ncbi:prolyl oligopeptidase family serine peptidase [Novosphingobium mangrovi (ex Hu et al. 2023)]|uniref:Prolyl oligopeptidase family serine peptidase n=1 Tax=Novosphingobium mangrovi (ex Hu et al. 2023) TaxID=2930094 RepID=A0ABT0ABQ3_9SPHN|nr:prolyl oligopeptidase family serine peptidase [Novosphingobium mangrovi (ex Hu et al. 2023)]MCJ1960625.1 prolyl oligopeptidase family serine peptidase [Novosphingobium mangrovi (ex Hu et al. 2023)]